MQDHVQMLRDIDHNYKIYQLEDLSSLLLDRSTETPKPEKS